jgi:hypothetical protein
MKKHQIKALSFFVLFLSITCSEDNPVEINYTSYNGTWLWLKTEGGYAYHLITPGDSLTVIAIYNNFGEHLYYRNGSLKVSARYEIQESEYARDKIIYSNIHKYNWDFYTNPVYAEIQSDTMKIWDGMIDGFFSYYKKIR